LLLLHITPRPDAIARDADRLRTIILKRLDGAERARGIAEDLWARARDDLAREILEALDA
jgi:hypothetical protein